MTPYGSNVQRNALPGSKASLRCYFAILWPVQRSWLSQIQQSCLLSDRLSILGLCSIQQFDLESPGIPSLALAGRKSLTLPCTELVSSAVNTDPRDQALTEGSSFVWGQRKAWLLVIDPDKDPSSHELFLQEIARPQRRVLKTLRPSHR